MAERILPNIALKGGYDVGEDEWGSGMNDNLLKLSVLVQAGVMSKVSSTPSSPADGDVYIFDEDHPTQPNTIAVRDDGAWVYLVPAEGCLVYDRAENEYLSFNGTVWAAFSVGGAVAVTDEGNPVVSAATQLNFTGAGVEVISGGSGVATINIPGTGSGGPVTLIPPVVADFSSNLNSLTASDGTDALVVDSIANGGIVLRGIFQAAPVGSFSVRVKFSAEHGGNFNGVGIMFRNTTPTYTGIQLVPVNTEMHANVGNWSSSSSIDSSVGSRIFRSNNEVPNWLRLDFDSSTNTVTGFWSFDGKNWIGVASTTYIGAVAELGIGAFMNGSNGCIAFFEHFEVI